MHRMKQLDSYIVEVITNNSDFKEWDLKDKISRPLMQFAYDFVYPNYKAKTPTKRCQIEISELLHQIKRDSINNNILS